MAVADTDVFPHKTSKSTVFGFSCAGEYRVYIKEPGATHALDSLYTIPRHQNAAGTDATEIVPIFCYNVTETSPTHFQISYGMLHNPLNRAANNATGYASITAQSKEIKKSDLRSSNKPVDLGTHLITYALWSDVCQAHGRHHSVITSSTYSDALTAIYFQQLTAAETGALTLTYLDGEIQRVVE